MPFLSSASSNRQWVLLCARLLVQCAMGSHLPSAGIDECKSLPPPHLMSVASSRAVNAT